MTDTVSRQAVIDAIEGLAPSIYDMGEQFIKKAIAITAINAIPVVTVTDEMVKRAACAFYNDAPGHGRCISDAMRAALVAALGE